MVNSPKNRDLIFVFLGLLFSPLPFCLCVGPRPLVQESIVPERDLTPRNFNPHPYVSAVAGITASVLSNFDHPYTAVASKRSGYFRNGSNGGVHRQLDTDPGRSSINSLANFARRFLGLTEHGTSYNFKKPRVEVVGANDVTKNYHRKVDRHPIMIFAREGGHRIIDVYATRSRNGQNNSNRDLGGKEFANEEENYDGGIFDGDGKAGGRSRNRMAEENPPSSYFFTDGATTTTTRILEDQRQRGRSKPYLGNTLNLASVQQSSLNEDALSLGDTNDNLSQGFYDGIPSDDQDLLDRLGRGNGWINGIESYDKPFYFITSNSNYRYLINDELHLEQNPYFLYS